MKVQCGVTSLSGEKQLMRLSLISTPSCESCFSGLCIF